MSRVRLHIPPERWSSLVGLEAPERRHLIGVLRLKAGDRLEVFDGKGGICLATLVGDGDQLKLELGPRSLHPDSGPTTRMALALLKGKKLDQVVRMLTEIGVDEIRPFTCERSVSRPSQTKLEDRTRRWKSIAAQAARQCGRTTVLDLTVCSSFEQILDLQPGEESQPPVRVLLHEKEGRPAFSELLDGNPGGERLILVGPEGGFTDSEVESARQAGFSVAGLGLPVLRAETAAIVSAAFACLDRKPLVE